MLLAGAPALAADADEDAAAKEIIVTAQRRQQTMIEVPQSVSVVNGEVLQRQQAASFLDYAALVRASPSPRPTQGNRG